jgi:SAM-dependent methyltransferase
VTVGLRRDPGLWLLLHLRPPGDRGHDRHGRCSVCGAETRFVRNTWVLPRELRNAWPESFVARESMFCAECGSSRRVRLLADVLLELYARAAASVADLVREEDFRALRVAEINAAGRMHAFLAPHPRLTYVEFPQEDVQALSWPDASFDLVLTSETLEHVQDLHLALAETRRILRPGGRHVFTVPVDPRLERTRSRAGEPPQHHGRGGGPFALVTRRADMLAHWDVGRDVPELLRGAGFTPDPAGSPDDGVYAATATSS